MSPVAISCAVASGFMRSVYAVMTMGRFIPVTAAHVGCPSSKPLIWLNGVPPHRSTRKSTCS